MSEKEYFANPVLENTCVRTTCTDSTVRHGIYHIRGTHILLLSVCLEENCDLSDIVLKHVLCTLYLRWSLSPNGMAELFQSTGAMMFQEVGNFP